MSPRTSINRPATAVAFVEVVAAFSATFLWARGLSELAHARDHGVALVALGLVVRTLGVLVRTAVLDSQRSRDRRRLRGALVAHLRRPARAGDDARPELVRAVEQLAESARIFELGASAVIALIVGLVLLDVTGGWQALGVTTVLLGLAVPLYVRAGRRSETMLAGYHERRDALERRQLELLTHVDELRALGAVEFGVRELDGLTELEQRSGLEAIRVALGSSLVTEFLSGVGIGLVAMVVGFGLLGGRESLTHGLWAVLIASEIFAFVRRFGAEFHRREDAAGAAARLSVESVTPRSPARGLLTAVDVVTRVDATPRNFLLESGARLLVRGPSGSGKTTLLETVVGWQPPHSGEVHRAPVTIGWVSPHSTVLARSLRENLTLGTPASDEVLRHVLADLALDGPRFADLDAPLSPDGAGLSSGERVRLVLGRALLAHCDVLVLDDIAGLFDASTRARVRATLESFPGAVVEASVDAGLLTASEVVVLP